MSDTEPVSLRPVTAPLQPMTGGMQQGSQPAVVAFNRQELRSILNLYGRKVAAGEWRDYAIDHGKETAAFSVYRRASECPLYSIVKAPRLARRQGIYSVVSQTGLIMKRGNDLDRVLAVLDRTMRLVD